MRFRQQPKATQSPQEQALGFIRSLSDEEWKRFKRAGESYRKSDKILSGDDGEDDELNDISNELIETQPKN